MNRSKILAVVAAVVVGGGLSGCFHADESRPSLSSPAASKTPAGVEVADFRQTCRTDMDCDAGNRCIVPAGASIRNGICGTLVDQEGVRLTERVARAVPNCVIRQDCPLAFSCRMVSSLDGLCVK